MTFVRLPSYQMLKKLGKTLQGRARKYEIQLRYVLHELLSHWELTVRPSHQDYYIGISFLNNPRQGERANGLSEHRSKAYYIHLIQMILPNHLIKVAF